ncbi:MAG: hypothetical protein L3J31_05485 [Bacteroidales bacterium]|nr:hypothetical protein [Bacteroidales bacterium]
MEDLFTYIIVFGLIIGGVAVWQLRRSKPRPYVLSTQYYPELKVQLYIEKQEGKTKDFVIRLNGLQELTVAAISIELISKSRAFQSIEAGQIEEVNKLPFLLRKYQTADFSYPFDTFKSHLQKVDFPFTSFRISIETTQGKKCKSHELAFNKTWVIYRPDSGSYN